MSQLRALVALRWQMIRDARVRRGLLLLAAVLPGLVVTGGVAGQVARDADLSFNILLLAPSLFLGFAVLTVVAALSSGGGNELFPSDQLTAFPVEARTVFYGSLASAPLNLAWATQVVALVTATAFVSDQSPLVLLALLTTLSYIALATATGQALGWYVVGVRHGRRGRQVTSALAALLAAVGGAVVLSGHGVELLDQSPTTSVTVAAVQGSQHRLLPWSLVTLTLVVGTVVALRLGSRAAQWALRRPEHASMTLSRAVRRRPVSRSTARALLRTDRNSVWRAAPLRRGLLVLALLPGTVTAVSRVDWSSLALLPGLVSAGAGLLFGVNAFCLDAQGGPWLCSLPHAPRLAVVAKARVVAETCLVAVALAVGVGALGARGTPSAAEAASLVASALALTLTVTATCLRLAVERPHRADLRGPRDAPAPPATMAVYSLRLALTTTFLGMLFVGAGASGEPVAGLLVGLVVALLAAASLRRTFRTFDAPAARARVVMVVAAG